MFLNKEQKKELLANLLDKAENSTDLEDGAENVNSDIFLKYSIQTDEGKRFYQSLSDELLLSILRKRADTLGHSPAQKEMFWVWREYIKTRFRRWPYALKSAGLSKAAGKNGKSREEFQREQEEYLECIRLIQDKAVTLCRIPHPKDIPQILSILEKRRISWSDFVKEAGIDRKFFLEKAVYAVQNLNQDEKEKLQLLLNMAWKIGRPPLKEEVPSDLLQNLIQKCGSYRNVLFQIGLEPVEKKRSFSMNNGKQRKEGKKKHRRVLRECYYQVLTKDIQFHKDIQFLWEWKKKRGRLPERKDIDLEVRKRLQKVCGSWANVLRQLEYKK